VNVVTYIVTSKHRELKERSKKRKLLDFSTTSI